jgi:hypothetical protein
MTISTSSNSKGDRKESKRKRKEEPKYPKREGKGFKEGYLSGSQKPQGSVNSADDFRKVETLMFNIGYWSTKGSIDLAVGVIAAALESLKDIAVGCVEAIKNSKNPAIKSQAEQALVNSATNDLSEEDKQSLSQGIKINDNEYRTTATFIDDLYQNSGTLANSNGSIESGEYVFNRTILENGDRQYFISKNSPDSGLKVEAFILDKDRNVVANSNTFSKEDKEDSMKTIDQMKQNPSLAESNVSANSQPIEVNNKLLAKIESRIPVLSQEIKSIEIKEIDTDEERLKTKTTLLEQEKELLELNVEINKLSGAIETEISQEVNSNNPDINKSLQQSLGKLESISKTVKIMRGEVSLQQNNANTLDVNRVVLEAESNVEKAESTEVQSAVASSIQAPGFTEVQSSNTRTRTQIETTTSSFEVSESEVEQDYSPEQ